MKKYAFTFSSDWVFDAEVEKQGFLLRCVPGTYAFQRPYACKIALRPIAASTRTCDVYGNEMLSGSIDRPHTSFGFSVSGFVLCSKYFVHEPVDRLYLYPTPLTLPSPAMADFLAQLNLPSAAWDRAQALCSKLPDLLTYAPGSTTVATTAAEAFASGAGVSRDFVHVFLCLCRMCGIAARFVSGLAVGFPRAHSWAEVYCDGAWRALDPTSGQSVDVGYLKIANGPDYAPCAVSRYFFKDETGSVGQEKTVEVQVTEHIIRFRDTVPHA